MNIRFSAISGVVLFVVLIMFLQFSPRALGATDAGAQTQPPPPSSGVKSLADPTGIAHQDAASQVAVPVNPTPAGAVPASSGFDYPVGGAYHEGFEMNNCFGCDYLDLWGHTGEDFDSGSEGAPVYSVSEGVVVYRGVGPGAWGNVMIIQHVVHGEVIYSQYAHMRDMIAVTGQTVARRQQIGTVGTTGTTAPHLHFEIKTDARIGHGYTGYSFSNTNILSYDGMIYYAPSWWIDNHRYFWDEYPDVQPPAGRHYYWTWYDNLGARNWVLLGNLTGGGDLSFDMNIRKKSPNLQLFGGANVGAGQVATPTFPGLMGGPVIATSLSGGEALVSQRVIWGSSSLEEVPGIEEGDLSSHYYWPWYDMASAGFRDWVLLANPSFTEAVTVTVSFRDQASGQSVGGMYDLGPGQSYAFQFPGSMGGPVEAKAWVQGGAWDNASDRRPVIASQRLLLYNGAAFNEMPGIPAESLDDHQLWTWYDQLSAGARNWVLLANPSATETVSAQVYFINRAGGQGTGGVFNIAPGQSVTPQFPGAMGGPVEVKAWVGGGDWANAADRRPVIASQRSLWGPSFEETPGVAVESLNGEYNWTWYDQLSPGMINWILVSNINNYPVYYEIEIPGTDVGQRPGARGVIPPGQSATPTFPGKMGGPVSVHAWTDANRTVEAPVMSSQRVLYQGFINEVVGTAPGSG